MKNFHLVDILIVLGVIIALIVGVITGLLGTDDWKDCWNAHHNDSIGQILDPTKDMSK